ncbi:arginine--tRNA ligase [Mucilaginibacter sabulilitoris]|uniref:Arginine--tRNA ligase n=1 Tax=Mucilaginibacter sabulilitoris TaxID=1173583 RepID=A0ABZ0TWS9_9SPHI|nr:arginine--tRNA ligase [Mucilaginibacter sabulilitoris]WPU96967.1 arginine--tRNA ligase [Mucilaginibacter sabulilitoris]
MYSYKSDVLKDYLSEILFDAVYIIIKNISIDEIYNQLIPPPDTAFGHFTFPCFFLARAAGRSPLELATQIADHIATDTEKVERFAAVGPYINFTLTSLFTGEAVGSKVLSGIFFDQINLDDRPLIMIEYSQPNTHKELHVGHMRNMCLGDALVRIHKYCGFKVISATFPGDVGTHVAKCLWYMEYYNSESIPSHDQGTWLGSLYTKAHLKLASEEGTPHERVNKEQLTEILYQIENKTGHFYLLWKETRQWSIALMNEVYRWANIHFDQWYWESDVTLSSVHYVKGNLHNGVFVQSEGAVGVDLSEFNLGFCLLIKSDGNGLYATKDLELAKLKFSDYNIEKSIIVVDQRQGHHFAQVFKVLEVLGDRNAKNNLHLSYNFVELPGGAMSSRAGNIIPILDLIKQMTEKVKIDHLNRNNNNLTSSEIEDNAKIIAEGAIKYGMNKIDPDHKIIFDMDEWLKIDGDAGPYLQYTTTRINSLINKLGMPHAEHTNWSVLTSEVEKNILIKISRFNEQVVQACTKYKPNLLANYLYELSRLYNSFYNSTQIKDSNNQQLKAARISLSACVLSILKSGLSLLGISIPTRM